MIVSVVKWIHFTFGLLRIKKHMNGDTLAIGEAITKRTTSINRDD